MDLKILEKKEEPLLSRKSIIAEVSYEQATPSNKDVKSKVASELKVSENLLVIKHIHNIFGNKRAKIIAYLYDNENGLKSVEPKEKTPKVKKEGENAQEEAKK